MCVHWEGVRVEVWFMGWLVAAVNDWSVVAFGYAMFCFISGDARPLLLPLCSTS